MRWAAGGGRHVLLTSLDVKGASHVASRKHFTWTPKKLVLAYGSPTGNGDGDWALYLGSTAGKFVDLGAGGSLPFPLFIPRQRAVRAD